MDMFGEIMIFHGFVHVNLPETSQVVGTMLVSGATDKRVELVVTIRPPDHVSPKVAHHNNNNNDRPGNVESL